MSLNRSRLLALLGEQGQDDLLGGENPKTAVLAQHLILAAQETGVDLGDTAAVAGFLDAVKRLVSSDRSLLLARFRTWTRGKERSALAAERSVLRRPK